MAEKLNYTTTPGAKAPGGASTTSTPEGGATESTREYYGGDGANGTDEAPNQVPETTVEAESKEYTYQSTNKPEWNPPTETEKAGQALVDYYAGEYAKSAATQPTREQMEKDAKRRKWGAIMAAIGDGGAAVANLIATHNYAPNNDYSRSSLSAAMQQRYDRLDANYKAKRDELRALGHKLADAREKQNNRAYARYKDYFDAQMQGAKFEQDDNKNKAADSRARKANKIAEGKLAETVRNHQVMEGISQQNANANTTRASKYGSGKGGGGGRGGRDKTETTTRTVFNPITGEPMQVTSTKKTRYN